MISDLVLGTMYFGTRTDEKTSFALLDHFVEAGGRTIDTANCYSFWSSESGAGGQSEETIGRWLAARPGMREQVEIATKVGVEPLNPQDHTAGVEGLSPEVIGRACDDSLERLGIDRIDLYWAHGEDRSTAITATAEAMGRLVADGKVTRLGISNHPTWLVERGRAHALAQGLEPWTALQLTTSYVRPRPDVTVPGKDHRFGFVTDETLDYVAENQPTELWAYSPLIQGSYDRDDRPFPTEYDHPGTTRRLAILTEVATELGATRGQVVLAWLRHSTPSIRPILGVSSLAQLDEALAAGELVLDATVMERLDGAS